MSNPYEPEMTKAHWAKRREKGTLYLEFPICGRRIDGLVALAMAVSGPKTEAPAFPYHERGIRRIDMRASL